jgi:hypothetical protein
MTKLSTTTRTELAHRASGGVEVTLVWVHGDNEDGVVVSVRDRRTGAYFEIPTERYLTLEVFHHPFAYRDFGTVGDEGACLVA